MVKLRPSYFMRLLDSVSQLANVFLFNGDANESISGRVYREDRKKIMFVIDKLIFWETSHCYWAYLNDIARAREIIKQHDLPI